MGCKQRSRYPEGPNFARALVLWRFVIHSQVSGLGWRGNVPAWGVELGLCSCQSHPQNNTSVHTYSKRLKLRAMETQGGLLSAVARSRRLQDHTLNGRLLPMFPSIRDRRHHARCTHISPTGHPLTYQESNACVSIHITVLWIRKCSIGNEV